MRASSGAPGCAPLSPASCCDSVCALSAALRGCCARKRAAFVSAAAAMGASSSPSSSLIRSTNSGCARGTRTQRQSHQVRRQPGASRQTDRCRGSLARARRRLLRLDHGAVKRALRAAEQNTHVSRARCTARGARRTMGFSGSAVPFSLALRAGASVRTSRAAADAARHAADATHMHDRQMSFSATVCQHSCSASSLHSGQLQRAVAQPHSRAASVSKVQSTGRTPKPVPAATCALLCAARARFPPWQLLRGRRLQLRDRRRLPALCGLALEVTAAAAGAAVACVALAPLAVRGGAARSLLSFRPRVAERTGIQAVLGDCEAGVRRSARERSLASTQHTGNMHARRKASRRGAYAGCTPAATPAAPPLLR
jgi:hypothetical protein